MDWDKGYESSDVEDRRGQSPGRGVGGFGGLGLLASLVWRFGWKGGLLLFGLLAGASYFLRGGALSPTGGTSQQKAGPDEARSFVGYVLDDVQKSWATTMPDYRHAKVVLYSDETTTGCGVGESAVGPFYCPRDEKVYLDVTFFRELHDRFRVDGDFAQAYVIAHELGHHIQKLTGQSEAVEKASHAAQLGAGHLSVRLELQADCYAGVWAHDAEKRGKLQPGDIASAMKAAAAIGDDRLQKSATGTVQPEKWTHGSSAERTHWFERGHQTGDPRACDTFHQDVDQ